MTWKGKIMNYGMDAERRSNLIRFAQWLVACGLFKMNYSVVDDLAQRHGPSLP